MSSTLLKYVDQPEKIRTDLVVVFDWYDGPREGVCRLSTPELEIWFELLDERPTQDGLDERIYRAAELPPGSVDELLRHLQCFGSPSGALWVPQWHLASEEEARGAELAVARIREQAVKTGVVLLSRDMQQFLGCWEVDDGVPADDWFRRLGLAEPVG